MGSEREWIVVRNWERFQHPDAARSSVPPWIKNYTELLSDEAYLTLTPNRRSLLHAVWMEYARSRRRLPVATASLAHRFAMVVRMRDLEALRDAGFIDFSASKPASEGARRAARVEKRRREEGSPAVPIAPNGALGTSGSPAAKSKNEKKPRPRDELWDAFVEICGEALTTSERSGRGKAVKEVREAGGRPEQLRPAAAEFRRIFPQLTMTDLAIARHWGKLVGKPRAEFRCPICGVVEKTQRKLNYHVEVIHA